MSKSPRVALVLPYYDARLRLTPRQQLAAQPTLAGFAAACAAEGLTVGAFQLFAQDQRFVEAGVDFSFVSSPPAARWLGRVLQRRLPRHGAAYYEAALPLWRAVRGFRPDIVHVFGLTLDLNLALGSVVGRTRRQPMVAHFHGGGPEADPLTRGLRRQTLGQMRRAFFTAREQAAPWIAAGLLPEERVTELAETSTLLRPINRAAARAATGMTGEPCCLMVGRLDPIKDPVTSLTAFMLIAERRPLAQLYVCSQGGVLQPMIEALVAATPSLAGRVHFLWSVPQSAMANVYSSADLLLQASLREWSSLSVIEALACGVTPILSDIPAFRSLTGGGTFGHLVPVRSPARMAEAALDATRERQAATPTTRAYFERELSFQALARRLAGIYGDVIHETAGVLS